MNGDADSRTANGGDENGEQATASKRGISRVLARLFGRGVDSGQGTQSIPEPVAAASAYEDRVSRDRREMIERVVAFNEKSVGDVMAPRADIIAVDVDTGLPELIKEFAQAGHSRMPVYRGDLDNPLGMVHIKDMVALIASPPSDAAQAQSLSTITREILYTPPSMRVTDLLLRMQDSRIHMALVIDEFGGTDGLVTIEDLVEQIVGEINDEHDEEEEVQITPASGGGWEVDARVELAEFVDETRIDIPLSEDEQDVDTLGGLVFTLAGRVPLRGEVLTHESGIEFEVVDADTRKIRKLLIRKTAQAAVTAKAAE